VRGRLRKQFLGVVFDNTFEAEMFGPGVMVARTRGDFLTSTTLALTTPIDASTSEMRLLHYIAGPERAPYLSPVLQAIFRTVATPEVRKEVRIWNHKIHRARPVFLPHERGIRALRRWYAQFYEANGTLVAAERLAREPAPL
jgi:hypothetical protein